MPPKHQKLAKAVGVSWAAQFVIIVTGFIVPRMLNDRLGQELLGIWDLGWSFVSYFNLLDAGINSTVNRHVALYRSKGDLKSLNRAASTIAMIQRGVGAIILVLSFGAWWVVPFCISNSSPELVEEARYLVLILGASVALNTASAVYAGVITGCHRWSMYHWILFYIKVLTLVGMVGTLFGGLGVTSLALTHLGSQVLGRMAHVIAAHRVCSGLRISARNADLKTARELVRFGGKMYIGQMSAVIMHQTVNVMIAAFLGPAVLALFARPRSLVHQAMAFPKKFAFMLVPGAATLLTSADSEKIRNFAVLGIKNCLFISLPLMISLALAGGPLLHLWMGEAFANPTLIAILAMGFLGEIAFLPLNQVLFALNHHGRPSIVSLFAAAIVLVSVGALLFSGSKNLSLIAVAIAVPWTLSHAVYLPWYGCKRLNLNVVETIWEACLGPILCCTPLALLLCCANVLFPDQPTQALGFGLGLGGLCTSVVYWIWVIPERWKERLGVRLGGLPKKPMLEAKKGGEV